VLHLLDLGLIVFFWASARDGYHQTSAGSVLAMTREEVEHEFDLDATGTAVEDETNMVFFIETPQGREAFLGLPADLVPRSKRRRMSS
jgi:hypothetical protein